MIHIVSRAPFYLPSSPRQQGLGAIESLHLALHINSERERVLRRCKNVTNLFDKPFLFLSNELMPGE